MSFRRDRDKQAAWREWVKTHADELIAMGVPREVWADPMTWGRFVEHGYHPSASSARDVRFRLSDLSDDQQQRLYRFLDAVLPETRYGYSLWSILQNRFGAVTDAGQ